MKKIIYLLSLICVMLSSCHEDDAPEMKMPISDIVKDWDDDLVSATVNGVEFQLSKYTDTYCISIFYYPEAGMKDQLFLTGSMLGGAYELGEQGFEFAMAIVPINIQTHTVDRITFTGGGEVLDMGLILEVEGEIYKDPIISEQRIKITANYKHKYNKLAGRMFEIGFDDGTVCPEFLPGIETAEHVKYKESIIPASELVKIFFDDINQRYYNLMGIDRARIKFNDDLSYEVWFRYTGSDTFVKDDSAHFYYYNDKRIYFLDEEFFIREQASHFLVSEFDRKEDHFLMRRVRTPWNEKIYGLMGLYYELDEDKLIMRYVSAYGAFVFDIFKSITPDYYPLSNINKYFTPKAVFTEVK